MSETKTVGICLLYFSPFFLIYPLVRFHSIPYPFGIFQYLEIRRSLKALHHVFQPQENFSEWRLLYFISFLLLVGFFVLNMFVGVVVENFHKCRESQEKEERAMRAAKRQEKLEKKRKSEDANHDSGSYCPLSLAFTLTRLIFFFGMEFRALIFGQLNELKLLGTFFGKMVLRYFCALKLRLIQDSCPKHRVISNNIMKRCNL